MQGTCGSDSIYGWNLRVEKFHLSFRILPAFVGHKGKLFVTVRVFLLSLRQSNTDEKVSLTIVNNVVYFCQYLKKKSIFQFNLSILNIDFCEVYVICRAAQRTDNNFRKRNWSIRVFVSRTLYNNCNTKDFSFNYKSQNSSILLVDSLRQWSIKSDEKYAAETKNRTKTLFLNW